MKKSFKHLLTATAILAVALSASMMVSCVDEEIPEDGGQTNETIQIKDVIGTWYGCYAENGVVRLNDGSEGTYNTVAQVLTFNADGTGTCATYYFPYDLNQTPIAMVGGQLDETNGKFTYKIEPNNDLEVEIGGNGNTPTSITLNTLGNGNFCAQKGKNSFTLIPGKGLKKRFQLWEDLLRNGGNGGSDVNLSSDFLTDWENADSVILGLVSYPVGVPWVTNNNCAIPEAIRYDVKKADGWEMGFVRLCDSQNMTYHYFGLYNKYTGILRVFHYYLSSDSDRNHMTYRIDLGSEYVPVKYPYYNAMDFGVPTSHKYGSGGLEDGIVVSSRTSMDYSFQVYSSPYSIEDEGLNQSWYCFDIDLSGFVPKDVSWRNVDDNKLLLKITPRVSRTASISLAGTLKGSLSGTYVEPVWSKAHTSGLSKACTVMSGLSSFVGGQLNLYSAMRKASDGWVPPADNPGGGGNNDGENDLFLPIDNTSINAPRHNDPIGRTGSLSKDSSKLRVPGTLITNPPLNPTVSGIWYGVQAALAGTSFIMNSVNAYQGQDSPELQEKGKIELDLDAKISLDGFIKQIESTSEPVLDLSISNFTKANTNNGHLGTGIWGIQDDPVVYVDKDAILSTRDKFKIVKNENEDIWHNTEFGDYQARFIYFFDPSSVKINLNTELFSEIDSIKYNAFSGVYVEKETGYTDNFRKFLKIGNRATIEYPSNIGNNELNSSSAPKLIKSDPRMQTTERDKDIFGEKYSGRYVAKDSVHRYFGPINTYKDYKFAPDPQIYLPFDKRDNTIPAATFPDMEVIVTVFFNHKVKVSVQGETAVKEKTSYFQKHFVPKFVFLPHNEFKAKLEELIDFSNKSLNDQPVGTLANDERYEVYCPSAASTLNPAMLLYQEIADE